jgi:hypothetical protein
MATGVDRWARTMVSGALLAASALPLLYPSPAEADVYVRQVERSELDEDSHPDATDRQWVKLFNEYRAEVEYWLSNDRLAVTSKRVRKKGQEPEPHATLLVDRVAGTWSLISHRTKRYAVATLPVDPKALLARSFLDFVEQNRQPPPTITPNGLRRRLADHPCVGYELWTEGQSPAILETTVWTTEAFGVDPEKTRPLLDVLRNDYIRQLPLVRIWCYWQSGIPGFPLQYTHRTLHDTLFVETIAVEERPTPDRVFLVPQGYARVEKLEMRDLYPK